MSIFRFRLQQLLEHRRRLEDGCKKELSQQAAALEREETALEGMYGSLNSCFDEWEDGRRATARSGDEYRMHYRYAQHLESETKRQMDVIRQQEDRVEQARAALVEASKDKKALERIREKRLAAHRADLDRRERAFLDDIAMRNHYDRKEAV